MNNINDDLKNLLENNELLINHYRKHTNLFGIFDLGDVNVSFLENKINEMYSESHQNSKTTTIEVGKNMRTGLYISLKIDSKELFHFSFHTGCVDDINGITHINYNGSYEKYIITEINQKILLNSYKDNINLKKQEKFKGKIVLSESMIKNEEILKQEKERLKIILQECFQKRLIKNANDI